VHRALFRACAGGARRGAPRRSPLTFRVPIASSAPPEPPFAPAPPWGTHAPAPWIRALIARCHALPATRSGGRRARILRTLARLGPSRPLDVELWGLRLRLHTKGNVAEARILFMPQLWEPGERALLTAAAAATPGFIFVDAGANVGGYSLWILSILRNACTVLAIEPDPTLRNRLLFNVRENDLPALRLEGVALGDGEGEGELLLGGRNRGENRLLGPGEALPQQGGAERTRVPVRTLLSVVRGAGLPRIDALKIDIEGMELRVLRAFFAEAPPTLHPRLLLMEHHDTPDHRALEALLGTLGYRTRLRSGLNLVLERGG